MSSANYARLAFRTAADKELHIGTLYDIRKPGYNDYTVGLYKGVKNGKLQFFDNRHTRHTLYEVDPEGTHGVPPKFRETTPNRWKNIAFGGTRKNKRKVRRTRR